LGVLAEYAENAERRRDQLAACSWQGLSHAGKWLTNGSHLQLAAMGLQLRAISLPLFSAFREKQDASRQLSVSSWQGLLHAGKG
jgi:hypothetical protein